MSADFDFLRALLRPALDYIRRDQAASYPLPAPVVARLSGRGICNPLHAPDYTTRDGSLTVRITGPDAVEIVAHEFPRSAALWNGPDVIPNTRLRSMLASLFHDLIWGHDAELAEAWQCSTATVYAWGDGILYAVWRWASGTSFWGRVEARLAWHACEFARPWYRRARQRIERGALMIAATLAIGGCTAPPPWTVDEIDGVDTVRDVMEQCGDGL